MKQKKELNIKMEISTKSKKKKKHLNKQARLLLVISGLLQLALIQIHIKMIINLYTTIIGFYLFAFVLFTLLNILNGSALSAAKTKMNIASISFVTALQVIFGFLYIRIALVEVATKANISFDTTMLISIIIISASVALSIISLIMAALYLKKKDDKLIYM